MLYFIFLYFLIKILISKKIVFKRERLFGLTLVISVFFFSSSDPFLKLPLFFEAMLVSLLYSFFKIRLQRDKMRTYIFYFLGIAFVMGLQMVNLVFGKNIMEVLLINKSSTDVADIASELYLPSLDFTVIKHFVFFAVYLLFVIANSDVIQNKDYIRILMGRFVKYFHYLFIGIIVECAIVNLFHGLNDRQFMGFIFSIQNLNQIANWKTFGIYTVAFSFTERSEMIIVALYYLIVCGKNRFDKKDIYWLVVSLIAIIATGSSSALMCSFVFLFYIMIKILLETKCSQKVKGLCIFVLLLGVLVVSTNYDLLFAKIISYLGGNESWGSSYFRRRANDLGMQAFLFSPFIGIGIGTVYCHGGLIAILSNIGLFGTLLMLMFHKKVIGVKGNTDTLFKTIIVILISTSAFLLQQLTSPYLLALFLCIYLPYLPKIKKGERKHA